VRAQSALSDARTTCRVPDHTRCPEGQFCDGGGRCAAGDPPPPAPDPAGPVGKGPCANDFPTEESLLAARAALAAGDPVVSLSPGGCIRIERTFADGAVVRERTTVAGAVMAEYEYDGAGGSTGRRDADLDGWFETTFTTGPDGSETVTRDRATKAVLRRETRTRTGPNAYDVVVEAGEDSESYAAGLANAADAFDDDPDPEDIEGEYCGNDLDKRLGTFLWRAMARTAKCLDEKGRGDLAIELLETGSKMTILCGDVGESTAAIAIDAVGGARRGRIIFNRNVANTDALGTMELLMHEVFHYTSLGLHPSPLLKGPGKIHARDADPVYACAALCATQVPSRVSKCQCATCLQTKECDERCTKYSECNNPEMGAICPCKWNNKWYPTYEQCVAGCSSGLLCFGYQRCKNLSRACDPAEK
jgi:hypothetical protein